MQNEGNNKKNTVPETSIQTNRYCRKKSVVNITFMAPIMSTLARKKNIIKKYLFSFAVLDVLAYLKKKKSFITLYKKILSVTNNLLS